MILRRVIEHVKAQNWTAVGLDFVIVVVGVFIGIQVSNWNAARVERNDERAVLGRLAEDFKAVEPTLARLAENAKSTTRSTGLLINALRADERPHDETAFREVLRLTGYVWDAPTPSSTYSELLSTGSLSTLSDRALRAALTRYADYSARYEGIRSAAMTTVFDPQSRYQQAVEWNTDADEWGGPQAVVSYDWELLLEAGAELQTWQIYQELIDGYLDGQLTELRAILAILEEMDL